jgi:hypothetical protein
MNVLKPQAPKPAPGKEQPRAGFPGEAKQRRARIKAAIVANRETLRRLAT